MILISPDLSSLLFTSLLSSPLLSLEVFRAKVWAEVRVVHFDERSLNVGIDGLVGTGQDLGLERTSSSHRLHAERAKQFLPVGPPRPVKVLERSVVGDEIGLGLVELGRDVDGHSDETLRGEGWVVWVDDIADGFPAPLNAV
jgi:hypothetical protein